MRFKKEILLLSAGLLLLSKEIRPLLLSKILPQQLQDQLFPEIDKLIDQITDILSRATENLGNAYNLGTLENKSQLLSHIVLLLMIARIGLSRLAIIFLVLSTLNVLSSNKALINTIENMESSLSFDSHLFSNILNEYPKQVSNIMEFVKIYWDISEKLTKTAIFAVQALLNPKESGLEDGIEQISKVIEMLKGLSFLQGKDIQSAIKMFSMLQQTKRKTKKPKKKTSTATTNTITSTTGKNMPNTTIT